MSKHMEDDQYIAWGPILEMREHGLMTGYLSTPTHNFVFVSLYFSDTLYLDFKLSKWKNFNVMYILQASLFLTSLILTYSWILCTLKFLSPDRLLNLGNNKFYVQEN